MHNVFREIQNVKRYQRFRRLRLYVAFRFPFFTKLEIVVRRERQRNSAPIKRVFAFVHRIDFICIKCGSDSFDIHEQLNMRSRLPVLTYLYAIIVHKDRSDGLYMLITITFKCKVGLQYLRPETKAE